MGWALEDQDVEYRFLYHNDTGVISDTREVATEYQKVLDDTTLFVAHNVKFDLGWLWEMGFKYEGRVWDTAIADYVLARGRKLPLSLKACCDRHGTEHKKLDIVEEYFEKGTPTQDIPADILQTYGTGDVLSLRDLYHSQIKTLELPENKGLLKTILMMNEFCLTLIAMERNGIKIDMDALEKIRKEFQDEKSALDEKLYLMVKEVMGDRPYNLASPEQLSQIIYSRKVKDKELWARTFNLGSEMRGAVSKIKYKTRMGADEFRAHVRAQTDIVKRSKARQCHVCGGKRQIPQALSGGRVGKRLVKCKNCDATGVEYCGEGRVAGFKLTPAGPQDCTVGGFATDADTILGLLDQCADDRARDFIKTISRVNALETYLSTFVEGINKNVLRDHILHPNLNQTITATGRLSSSNPNFQNLPRGNTFPVKRAIVSRFGPDGLILDADYAGIEYRAAVYQAQDKAGMDDLKNKVDPHTFTRLRLEEAGEIVSRQDAKPFTFKPLYGGQTGTDAQRAYFKAFMAKHEGIAAWQDRLQTEAISTKKIVLETGREYAFPDAERTKWGGSTFATQIKNYPVQGFATGDIAPIGIMLTHREMLKRKLNSLLILETHDNLLMDVYPGELDVCVECCRIGMLGVVDDMVSRYGIYFNVPIGIEIKAGRSWLEAKEIGKWEHPGIGRPN